MDEVLSNVEERDALSLLDADARAKVTAAVATLRGAAELDRQVFNVRPTRRELRRQKKVALKHGPLAALVAEAVKRVRAVPPGGRVAVVGGWMDRGGGHA